MKILCGVLISLFFLTGCLESGSSDSSQTSAPSQDETPTGPSQPLSVAAPANLAYVGGRTTLSGTCRNEAPVLVLGTGLDQALAFACRGGFFSQTLVFTSAAGAKNFSVSQLAADGSTAVFNLQVTNVGAVAGIEVISPANLSRYKVNPTITGTCYNGAPISVSGAGISAPASWTCSSSSFSSTLNFSTGDGTKTITLTQTDAVGNSRSQTLTLFLDTVAPTIQITSPADGSSFVSSAMISGTCETGLPVNITSAGIISTVVTGCSGASFSAQVQLTGSDGSKTITISQTDQAGNNTSITHHLTRDTLAPALTFTSPSAGTSLQNTVSVTGSCETGLSVALAGDVSAATSVACSGGVFSQTLTLSAGDGNKTITAKQIDAAGNQGTASLTVKKDMLAPAILIQAPLASSATSVASTTVSGTCETGLTVTLSGAGLSAGSTTACTAGAFSKSVSFSSGDGNKNISVSQTDAAGNAGSDSVQVTLDTTAPVLTVTAPTSGAMVQGSVTVSGTCETNLMVFIQGTGAAGMASGVCVSGSFSIPVTLSSGDGAKSLSLSSTDAVGNLTTISHSLTKDTVAPALAVTGPAEGANVRAVHAITGTCENGSSITVTGDVRSATTPVTCSGGVYSVSMKILKSAGLRTLTVSASDAAGNRTDVQRHYKYAGDVSMGVNLAQVCVGYNSHWGYPADVARMAWDFDYYKSKGFTLFRFPIDWEGIQTTLNGPLTTWQVSCLHDALNLARAKDIKIIFDIHNYARYLINNVGGSKGCGDVPEADCSKMGSAQLPISAFQNLWTRIATEFNSDAGLFGYDLMNEPHDMLNANIWPQAVQAAVNGIRSVDMTTTIIIEGDGWAGAPNWATQNANLVPTDPANNFMFSAHLYFDDGSGKYTGTYDSYGTYPMIGVDRAKPFVDWLKANGYRGYFGEYGAPADDPRWQVVVDNFLDYITSQGVHGTVWAAGYLWNIYGQQTMWYNLEPLNGEDMPANPVDRPGLSVLKKYPSSVP